MNSQFKHNLKGIFSKSHLYRDCLQKGRIYCSTPQSITLAATLAATSWHINEKGGIGPIFEKPLGSFICIGLVSLFTDLCATTISDCISHNTKPMLPIILFGSVMRK